ncbi:MAG: amidohydrolase [Lachnospiraceae bacterium]|nr:amidohydrolase [Lachnospiraceae bacterium]
MNSREEFLRKEGESLQEKLVGYRRALHACPELQMETPETERRIVQFLRETGIDKIRSGVGGHGVTAMIRGSLPGKCLALRADMDGLPIKEETGLPFASTNGSMHACGHDFHMAVVLGAAELLFRHRAELRGDVKLIFQPYEEGDGGAKRLIAEGVLRDPKVDAILGFHNGCHLDSGYRAGDVLVTPKPTSANIFAFKATFSGNGGHVCLSRERVNPLYAAAEAVSAIRALSLAHPDAIVAVTVCHAGVRNNVIPETCVIEGSLRSFDREEQAALEKEVRRIADEAGRNAGADVRLDVTIDVMSIKNDRAMYERFKEIAASVYPESGTRLLDPVSFIGEDFARYTEEIPGYHFFLCARPEGSPYPHHSPKFDVDESVLSKGSILMAAFALGWQEA